MGEPPKLLDRVRASVRTRHYSIRTEEAYVTWARRYILFHGKKHPSAMGAEEINAFLTHLAVDRNVSASTQNQALSAILFLYREVLGEEVGWIADIVRATRPRRLPVVFTRDEVVRILTRLEGVERIVGELLYGTGLRVIEAPWASFSMERGFASSRPASAREGHRVCEERDSGPRWQGEEGPSHDVASLACGGGG
jgi:site-specific recombinase XerD